MHTGPQQVNKCADAVQKEEDCEGRTAGVCEGDVVEQTLLHWTAGPGWVLVRVMMSRRDPVALDSSAGMFPPDQLVYMPATTFLLSVCHMRLDL
eukprot:1162101-Pelagomonas_calceolata.AAC.9